MSGLAGLTGVPDGGPGARGFVDVHDRDAVEDARLAMPRCISSASGCSRPRACKNLEKG